MIQGVSRRAAAVPLGGRSVMNDSHDWTYTDIKSMLGVLEVELLHMTNRQTFTSFV